LGRAKSFLTGAVAVFSLPSCRPPGARRISLGRRSSAWEWDEAVGCYMGHENISRAIYRKLYVNFNANPYFGARVLQLIES
jgi:hypothetical protein